MLRHPKMISRTARRPYFKKGMGEGKDDRIKRKLNDDSGRSINFLRIRYFVNSVQTIFSSQPSSMKIYAARKDTRTQIKNPANEIYSGIKRPFLRIFISSPLFFLLPSLPLFQNFHSSSSAGKSFFAESDSECK